jgi:hypothetical protein
MNKKGIARNRINNIIVGYHQLLVQVVDIYENIHRLNKPLMLALENENQSAELESFSIFARKCKGDAN